jgi:cytochrome c peroxidase
MSSNVFSSEASPHSSRKRSRSSRIGVHFLISALVVSGLSACAGEDDRETFRTVGQAVQMDQNDQGGHGHQKKLGEELFQTAFEGTNDRTCATCHVLNEHTVLKPQHVVELFDSNPNDPLFNPIDADDPDAEALTYDHLKKGLIRVRLKLPENMDLIDSEGNVTTPPDRTYEVWRAVPTVENSALSGPFQYDGRFPTLQVQAQHAITDHSQGPDVPSSDLDAIAAFQETIFSSNRAKRVAHKMDKGIPVEDIVPPELHLDDLTPAQERGRDVYQLACEACHGGATTMQITNSEVHALAFLQLNEDGNVIFDTSVTPPAPVPQVPTPDNDFMNIGLGNISYLGQIYGDFFGPRFNKDVALPQYRYRFYTDATRSVKNVDLPPVPVTVSGDPFDLRAALDENGAPIVGPNLLPQLWSTDPGRAGITGNPEDFEAFDIPPLRGIANTGPYFHDNSAETLRDAVDIYSRFILNFFTPLNLPAVNPPEEGSFFFESLTAQQKDDLMEYLLFL